MFDVVSLSSEPYHGVATQIFARPNVGDERTLEAHEVCRKPSARLTG